MLPLVDCLGFLKAEVGLQIPNRHAAFLSQTHDVLAGLDHVDDRKRLLMQGFRLLCIVVFFILYSPEYLKTSIFERGGLDEKLFYT